MEGDGILKHRKIKLSFGNQIVFEFNKPTQLNLWPESNT